MHFGTRDGVGTLRCRAAEENLGFLFPSASPPHLNALYATDRPHFNALHSLLHCLAQCTALYTILFCTPYTSQLKAFHTTMTHSIDCTPHYTALFCLHQIPIESTKLKCLCYTALHCNCIWVHLTAAAIHISFASDTNCYCCNTHLNDLHTHM